MKRPYGGNVKQLRVERGLSQQELARRSQMSQQMISKLERNVVSGTSHIVDLAVALGTNVEELTGRAGSLTALEDYVKSVKQPERVKQVNVTRQQYDLLLAYEAMPELRRAIDALVEAFKEGG